MSLQDDTLPRQQLHHMVSERLRTAILDGRFKPGEWLRQQRIAEELGVSQMPVREALKQLAAEGVVEHIPYRGVRVIAFSSEDVADLYAHRSFLEGRAARAAARNITSEQLAELRTLQAQMRHGLTPDKFSEYRRLNRRFHQIVYSASQRDYLIRVLDQIWSAFPMMLLSDLARTAARFLAERDAKDAHEHAAIIAALESGDADQAEKSIREHIETACQELLSMMSSEQ